MRDGTASRDVVRSPDELRRHPDRPFAGRLVQVVDGDTIDVLLDVFDGILVPQRVRFAGINAPELHLPGTPGNAPPNNPAGIAAKAYLSVAVSQADVPLWVQTAWNFSRSGGAGAQRLLAWVAVAEFPGIPPDVWLNQQMIAAGQAVLEGPYQPTP